MFRALLVCCFWLIAATLPVSATGDGLVDGPLRVIVPYAPGGVNDVVARIVADGLQDTFHQTVVVDNRPGGGTVIGTQAALQAPPDGRTVLLINPTTAINVSTFKQLPYDVRRDLAPLALIASYPNLLVVGASSPYRTVQELVRAAKASPGKLNYASGGNGGFTHLASELFKIRTDTDITHVPYKGSASTIPALISGDVAMAIGDPPAYLPQIRAGQLRALAVASESRYFAAPDVPTMSEAGVSGYVAEVWIGLAVRAGTPAATIQKLNAAVNELLANERIRERLRSQGLVPHAAGVGAFDTQFAAEIVQWAKVVQTAGIQPE
jgi:tripartite-type tricarboxylate transporter receptor subunit TctC